MADTTMKVIHHLRRPMMIRCPDDLKTATERREWMEKNLPIPPEMKKSKEYQSLSDNAKIISMIIDHKQRHRRRSP